MTVLTVLLKGSISFLWSAAKWLAPRVSTIAGDFPDSDTYDWVVTNYLMPTYARFPVTLTRGKGSYVYDDSGRKYLDFISGIAVNSLGHAHPGLQKAISEQAGLMIHCSNLFNIPAQQDLAEKLCSLSGLGRAFFCNSGAEANEAAFKLARKYWYDRDSDRRGIICAANSFHGRTLNTLTATGQNRVKIGFDPLPPGFSHVPYGDVDRLDNTVNATTAAIILEPIQGEGGVNIPPDSYLPAVRTLCNDHGILLILDEVQTGIGRCGRMFAFEHSAIRPDILTLAKGLGGGMPVGAMLATESVASAFGPGTHGSTFGGNPLSCRAALTVLDLIERESLLKNTCDQGNRLSEGLKGLQKNHGGIRQVRGQGLLLGVEMAKAVAPVIEKCRNAGLMLLPAGPDVIRFLPPLNVQSCEIDKALDIFGGVLDGEES